MTRVLVLSDASGQWRGSAPMSLAPEAPLVPVIETLDLDAGGLRDVLASPEVLAYASVMPTRLVEPEPLDMLRSEDAEPEWGLRAVGADRAGQGGRGVTVALLDTGIDTGHAAFAGMTLIRKDFAGTGIEDANGHGTHLAGLVFGRDLDGTRIGVARGIERAVIAKTLDDRGRGTSEGFLRALIWSAEQGADIVAFALALDASGWVDALEDDGVPHTLACAQSRHAERQTLALLERLLGMFAVNGRREGGCLVLGAVGNDSRRTIAPEMETGPGAPACASGVLTVAALGPDDGGGLRIAPFSNTGAAVAAPGAGVISARAGDGLRALNGSSMALGLVAGVAALWWEHLRAEGPVSAAQVAGRLLDSARREDLAPDMTLFDCGAGLVQAPRDVARP